MEHKTLNYFFCIYVHDLKYLGKNFPNLCTSCQQVTIKCMVFVTNQMQNNCIPKYPKIGINRPKIKTFSDWKNGLWIIFTASTVPIIWSFWVEFPQIAQSLQEFQKGITLPSNVLSTWVKPHSMVNCEKKNSFMQFSVNYFGRL